VCVCVLTARIVSRPCHFSQEMHTLSLMQFYMPGLYIHVSLSTGLGFSTEMQTQAAQHLSGGWRMRISLGLCWCSVLQCVAVCCSALQCVTVRCSVLQCIAVCCSVLQCVAVQTHAALHLSRGWCMHLHFFRSVLVQCVAVCCSVYGVLQCVAVCVAVCCSVLQCVLRCVVVCVCCSVLQCIAVCCSVLPCIALYCSVLQCIAVCRSVLQCVAVCRSVLHMSGVIHECATSRIPTKYVTLMKRSCCAYE